VTSNTTRFFTILGIPTDWLEKDPTPWRQNSIYLECQQTVERFTVMNNRAERESRIQEYNQILTKDDGQKQALLQVLYKHGKQYLDPKKTTATKINQ
jgi:hypothetical protein